MAGPDRGALRDASARAPTAGHLGTIRTFWVNEAIQPPVIATRQRTHTASASPRSSALITESEFTAPRCATSTRRCCTAVRSATRVAAAEVRFSFY